MVAESAQEGLVDRSSNELLPHGLTTERIQHRVRLLFDPEYISTFYILLHFARL